LAAFNASGNLYYGNSGFTNTLNTATLSANQTIGLPDESGTICLQSSASCGFATTTGGTGYIQNQSASAQSANFFIQSAAAATIGGIIRGAASQTADLFQAQDSTGSVLAKFDASGNLTAVNGNLTGTLGVTGTSTLTGALIANGGITDTGNFAQTGVGTFDTGTGAVSLNGNTNITGINTLTVGTGATTLGGTLGVAGLTTLSGGVDVSGASTITGTLGINTTGSAATTIGNATAAFSLASSGLNVSTAGAVSGVTTLTASGAIAAASSGDTINGLIISSGALSGITGYNQTSGNFCYQWSRHIRNGNRCH